MVTRNGDALSAPQPLCGWSMSWTDEYQYDTGSDPSLAIRSDGSLMECHVGVTGLFWRTGKVDSSGDVIWNGSEGTAYQNGTSPSLSVQTSPGNLLDIHPSKMGGDLYWTYATLSGDTLSFEDNGHDLFKGDHPGQHMDDADGTVVFMYSVGSDLEVTTGHFTGTVLSINSGFKNQKYASGDFPSLARHGSQIIETHTDGSDIYWNVLPVMSDSKLTWSTGPWPMMMKGNQPHVANDSDLVVVVYDDGSDLYYAIGKVIDGQKIAWKLLNGHIGEGETTAIATTPNGQFVMAYEKPSYDVDPDLHWRTGKVNAPS